MKKKYLSLLGCSLLVVAGCGKNPSEPTVQSDSKDPKVKYQTLVEQFEMPKSYSVKVNRSDDMRYEQDSIQTYDLKAGLEINESENQGHLSMELFSNGMESRIDGWYFDDKLHCNYNNVSYYQDMSLTQMEELPLVPLTLTKISNSQIESIKKESNKDKEETYEIILNEDGRRSIFPKFDAYGFEKQGNFEIVEGKIQQTFDQDGKLLKEESQFKTHLVQDTIGVDVLVTTSASYFKIDETSIRISNDQKEKMEAYVNYKDIDTSSISPYDPNSDSREDSAIDTLKKRLVNRLNYEVVKPDVYQTKFNDHESYTIDFEHHQFTYKNRSMSYVYNWKGNTGGFSSSCSYDFNKDTSTSGCDEDVLKMIKNVKLFFEMELYYCDLSLNELTD